MTEKPIPLATSILQGGASGRDRQHASAMVRTQNARGDSIDWVAPQPRWEGNNRVPVEFSQIRPAMYAEGEVAGTVVGYRTRSDHLLGLKTQQLGRIVKGKVGYVAELPAGLLEFGSDADILDVAVAVFAKLTEA